MKKLLIILSILLLLSLFLLIQSAYAESSKIILDGMWKYTFVDNDSFSSKYLDDSNWKMDSYGHKRVETEPEKQNRAVWLRKHFTIPSNMKNERLMVYIGSLINHEVYINGYFIGKSIATEGHSFSDWNRKHGYNISDVLLNYEGDNVLAIKTYSTYEYGSSDQIYIGDYSSIQEKVQFHSIFIVNSYLSLSVILFLIAAYFIMFYIKTRMAKKHLFFAILCLFYSIYYTNYYVYDLPIPYTIFQKIIFISLHIGCLCFMPFFKYFFDMKILKLEKWLFILFAFISISGAVFTDNLIEYFIFRNKYILLLSLQVAYYVVLCIRAFFTNRRAFFQIALGSTFLAIFISHDIYYEFIGKLSPLGIHLNGYALIIFLVCICMELMSEYGQMYTRASTDGLTGLFNYSYFLNSLVEVCRLKNSTGTSSLLIVDIDLFKKFNDLYGHLAGDYVLKSVAKTLKSICKTKCLVARYGGEEFTVLLTGYSEMKAVELAEKLRSAIEKQQYHYKDASIGKVTVSIGIVTFTFDTPPHPEILIEKADEALYYSKGHGRNMVTHYNSLIHCAIDSKG
ncbi:MAG: diguanylate cyclase [Clostridia bacterium]|nr:diguanylate cyclase [Clostridia bacterium]